MVFTRKKRGVKKETENKKVAIAFEEEEEKQQEKNVNAGEGEKEKENNDGDLKEESDIAVSDSEKQSFNKKTKNSPKRSRRRNTGGSNKNEVENSNDEKENSSDEKAAVESKMNDENHSKLNRDEKEGTDQKEESGVSESEKEVSNKKRRRSLKKHKRKSTGSVNKNQDENNDEEEDGDDDDEDNDTEKCDKTKNKNSSDVKSGSNSQKHEEMDKEIEKSENDEDKLAAEEKPAAGLRLVPLNFLLRQDILNKQDSKSTTKSSRRSKNKCIEISSDDEEFESDGGDQKQISISSHSKSDNESDENLPLGSKQRKSTKKKLANGDDDPLSDTYREPSMSPNKYARKSFTLNLELLPNNVNKLMKCYRLNDDQAVAMDAWCETDDFENMIETSKIDRIALDNEKSEKEKKEQIQQMPSKKIVRSGRKKIVVSSSSESEECTDEIIDASSNKNNKKNGKKELKVVVPSRSRSTRTAARNRKQIIEKDSSESESEDEEQNDDDDDDDIPLAKASTSTNGRSTRNKTKTSTKSEPTSQNSENSDNDDNKKRKNKENLTSKKLNVNEAELSAPPSAEKSKSREKSKGSDLKITINLNQNKVIKNSAKDENKSLQSSDSSPSEERENCSESDSDNEPIIKSIAPQKSTRTSRKVIEEENNERENEENISDIENSDNEKAPICDQKLRSRIKFESNKEFNKLKEKIEARKKKTDKSESDDPQTKEKSNAPASTAKSDKGKENLIDNHADEDENEEKMEVDEEKKSSPKGNKRKRVISSSEDEEEGSAKDSTKETKTPAKRRKRKMDDDSDYEKSHSESEKGADSDDSSDDEIRKKRAKDSSEEDEELDELEKGRGKGKRRKRIKKMDSSDEEGGGDKSKTASGRKAIRKIIRNDKLDVSTKEAAKIERERKQRIEERQKMYNQVYDERPEEIKEITSLVLDFDEETKEPLLEVDKKLVKKLKPHQANGVKFMWDACFESLERCENENGSGCILAHCMGLGKTLQVITLVHTLIANSDKTGVSRVLVVCPLNTVLNWVNEFHKWLKGIKDAEEVEVYEINKLKQNVDRANKLMEWHNEGGVMILSYDMFRNLSNDTSSRLRKKIKESLQTSLLDPGPDLVVCDEGHLLKNEKTSISKAMNKLRTLRRIVLTGTPLQNNLKEYYCMVQFVKPNLLGKYQEYMNRFVNPITNGQYTDSTEYDIQVMRRRAHVLHKLLDGCVQRRDYSVLAPFLPPKHEYIVSIKLTPMQANLYRFYMENKAKQNDDSGRKGSILFQDFQNLQRIWSAPKALRYNSDRYELEMQRRKDLESEEEESVGSIKDFLDDSESAASTSSDESEEEDDEDAENDVLSISSNEGKQKKKKKKKDKVVLPRRTRAMFASLPEELREEEEVQQKLDNPTEWWMQICPEEELNNLEHSSKLLVLMSILEKCEAIGDKLLVFSQSLYSLDVIEHFLNVIDDQTQHNAENASFQASWTLGLDYFRLDGSTPAEQRNQACKLFNSPDNPRARLFLISTRAGGLGINLVAANRVVIFDVSWNPSHDIQSIFRVYRFGQTKPCYIYRFLAYGTMEEKIYERQVTKQAISKRVIDEQQIDRHYNQNDLQELYKFDLEPDDDVREVPILPKDRLFAEMIKKYEDIIYKYHEHDTLLENKEEETLDEEERKAAWEEFEAEKNRPQFVSYNYQMQPQQRTGPVTSNSIFGIRTDVLLKLLSMKARLDNPAISEANVKHIIPMLMQELYRQMDRGELTLYHQLLALSSSLEVPSNYGGQFQVNERLMHQTYSSMSSGAVPSTSQAANSLLLRQQLVDRQKNLTSQLQRQTQARSRSPPRIVGSVIEID